jgi:2'-5' RNA ligase
MGDQAPRLRWTRPEGTHLTLKFLGETPRSKSSAVDGALREAATGGAGITLSLGKVGSFEDRRGPRVIFVTVEGDLDALQTLAARVDTALGQEGFPRERRPFQPHLTLARLPEEIATAEKRRIGEVVSTLRSPRPGRHSFSTLSLMRSHIERGGARYEQVRGYRLA